MTVYLLLRCDFGKMPSALFLSIAGSSWALSAQPSSPTQGPPVQLIAQGTALASSLTGTVQFSTNGKALGSATVTNNVATLTTSALPAGTNVVSAQYSGDTTHFATAIAPITLQVQALSPAFTLTGLPFQVAVTRGQTASVNLTVTANASFQGTIALTCENVPVNATCTFTPASLPLSSSAAGTSTLTIATSNSASLQDLGIFKSGRGVFLAALILLPLTYRRRKLLTAVLSSLVLIAFVGCAGSDANKTPLGTSFVTVRATATMASGSQLSQTLSVPLTVN